MLSCLIQEEESQGSWNWKWSLEKSLIRFLICSEGLRFSLCTGLDQTSFWGQMIVDAPASLLELQMCPKKVATRIGQFGLMVWCSSLHHSLDQNIIFLLRQRLALEKGGKGIKCAHLSSPTKVWSSLGHFPKDKWNGVELPPFSGAQSKLEPPAAAFREKQYIWNSSITGILVIHTGLEGQNQHKAVPEMSKQTENTYLDGRNEDN